MAGVCSTPGQFFNFSKGLDNHRCNQSAAISAQLKRFHQFLSLSRILPIGFQLMKNNERFTTWF